MSPGVKKLVEAYVEACFDLDRAGESDHWDREADMQKAHAVLDEYITRIEALAVTGMKAGACLRAEPPDFRPEEDETPG